MTLTANRQNLSVDLSVLTTSVASHAPALSLPQFVSSYHKLAYNQRLRLTFFVKNEFKSHFILLKGLFEFTRGRNFSFTYNKESHTIETDINVSDSAALETFLNEIDAWVSKEIAFKQALKKIIEFENEYRLKQTEAYASIM